LGEHDDAKRSIRHLDRQHLREFLVQSIVGGRWIGNKFSGIGPALRQGSNIWAGYQPTGQSSHNSSSWASYSYSGWATLLAGTSSMPAPDFSAGAAPIFFGFYQRNAGTGPNESQFANFSVTVTVPAPAALALVSIAMPLAGRRLRSR
jgi:hypothetical protein